MRSFQKIIFACVATAPLLALSVPVSAQVVEGEEHCVINVKSSDVLNVRSKGNASSKVVTTLRHGQCGVTVSGSCQGSWCPVEDGHNAGWVNVRFISMVSPARYCVTGVGQGDKLNLRAYPATSSRIITKLNRNQCGISFLPYATGSWQKVRVNGYEGWTNQKFLSGQ